jgi:hypothetical protein
MVFIRHRAGQTRRQKLKEAVKTTKTMRLKPKICDMIDGYRGKNFTDKFENLIFDSFTELSNIQ